MEPVNIPAKSSLFSERWRPKVVAQLNGQEVKLIKVQGVFPWHHHETEDELFLVWRGVFRVEFRDRVVSLDEEAEVICFEPAGVRNTGNVSDTEFTAPMGAQV